MTLPTWRDWLFSAKAFVAAMLALYVAMALSLPRPYWAMATVYVVSHPLTGATRSKALYRALGTLIGGAGAVLLVPVFVNEPILLSLVVALWTGTLLSLSMLDRTPRSYVFMLSAYTMSMIALPSVNNPGAVFDLALARSEEIIVGIVCASLVSAIVFPGKVAPVLGARIDAWLKDAGHWAADVLSDGAIATKGHPGSRHRLAADILALDQFISQLSYDTPSAHLVGSARELRGRMSMLLPVLSSLTETLTALRKQEADVSPELAALMHEIGAWIASGRDSIAQTHAHRFQKQLAALKPSVEGDASWPALLTAHAVTRLQSLINLWLDCLTLQSMIDHDEADPNWKPAYRRWEVGGTARHYDYGMMLFSAATASLATFLGCLLWIGTGWADGASAVILGSVVSCFFASLDEPAPMMRAFFVWSAVSIAISAVLLFLVIPAAYEFEVLVAMLAIPFLCIGTLFTRPQFTVVAMLLTVNTATFLGLQGAYDADFTAFFNGNIAGVVGVLYALIMSLLTRPFGIELAIRRLLRSSWRDLARTASGDHAADYATLTARMLDRLGLLMPRLAASGHDTVSAGFSELRVGFSALDLQRDEHRLARRAHDAVDGVLKSVARHYEDCLADRRHRAAPAELGEKIDAALDATALETGRAAREAQNALVELRVTLFPDAAAPRASLTGQES